MAQKSLSFQIKAVSDDGSQFTGLASAYNVLDRAGDIVPPGAFTKALPGFMKDGVICWNHDWSEPVGRPLDVKDLPEGLELTATISDTARGRDARTLLKDGVVKKLSIGYDVEEADDLTPDLLKSFLGDEAFAALSGKMLNRALYWGQLLKVINPLYEVSLVSIPANNSCDITAVKALESLEELSELLRSAGLNDRSLLVKATAADAAEYVGRMKRLAEIEIKAGREISAANREQMCSMSTALGECRSALADLHTDLDSMIARTSPASDDDADDDGSDKALLEASFKALMTFQAICAAQNGVAMPTPVPTPAP